MWIEEWIIVYTLWVDNYNRCNEIMLVLEAIEVCLNGLLKMDYTHALGLHYHGKG